MIQIGIISYVLLLQGIYTKDPVLELVLLEKYTEAQSAIEPDRITSVLVLHQLLEKLSNPWKS